MSHNNAARAGGKAGDELPAAAGDMPLTHADLERAKALLGFESRVPLREGLARTAEWTRGALGLT